MVVSTGDKITTAQELEQLRRQQERILNAVGEGIFGLDDQNHVTFVNPAALAMLGYEQHEVVGGSLHEIIHLHRQDGEMFPLADCPIYAASQDGIVRKADAFFRALKKAPRLWKTTKFWARWSPSPISPNAEKWRKSCGKPP